MANDLTPIAVTKPTQHHAPVTLVSNGQAKAVIVAAAELNQSRQVRDAVADLQSHIRSATGAELPIVDARPEGATAAIVLTIADPGEDEVAEGFKLETAEGTVAIIGHDASGLAHGIYDFLERNVGVRFYWPTYANDFADCGTYVPSSPSLLIEPMQYSDAPAFVMRERWPSGGPRIGKAKMADHDRRLRTGNTWPIKLIVHAPHHWDAIYKDDRPEIFQLRSDGHRDFGMLCYGHPRTLETYLEEIELQLADRSLATRGRSILSGNAITVSPGDMMVSCQCEHCRSLWNTDGGSYGTASHILADFVARLGRAVEKRWPELTIIYLPYKNYTFAPSLVTGSDHSPVEFPSNIQVQICGMPGLATYKDAAINAEEQANIDAWQQLTGRRIQNWHYSCWPANRTDAAYLFPHTVKAHYQANRDKTVGTFINGVGDHWPRQHVSLYVWLKVLWNPDIDVDAVVDAYCKNMYGPAADTMRELTGMLIAGWEQSEWSTPTLSPTTVYEESYPRDDVKRMEALLEQAYKEAKGNELVTRRLDYYAPSLRAFFAESSLLAGGEGIRPLNLNQTAEEPVIDGRLDDAVWSTIKPVTFRRVSDKAEPTYPTAMQAAWTRRGVTFAFRMNEPAMATLANDIDTDSRDPSLIWWNDNVEIFLDPTGARTGYYQIILNANGATWTSIGREDISWDPPIKVATHLADDHWSAEVYIPYDSFEKAQSPGTGTTWFGNFTRHRVNDRKPREYQGYNITTGAPSHNQNAFGPLRFIER